MVDLLMLVAVTQIITESLPISSSGHVKLIQELLQRWGAIVLPPLTSSCDHLLHGPTIFIVATVFFNDWWALLRLHILIFKTWMHRSFSYRHLPDSHKRLVRITRYIIGMVVVADAMTAVWYVIIKKFCHYQIIGGSHMSLLLVGFVATMLILLSERWCRVKQTQLTLSKAFIIGCAQGIATFPGISRFAITFVTARWLGLTPRRVLQFSFLLFFPLMCGAFLLSGLPALLVMNPEVCVFFEPSWLLIVGGATVVAYVFFVWACDWAKKKQLWWFGWYMIVPILITVLL